MRRSLCIFALLCFFLVAGFWGLVPAPHLEPETALAQDKTTAKPPEDKNRPSVTGTKEKTDAERIIQMQNAIEADKKKLNELKGEIAGLQKSFEEQTAELLELKGRIDERRKDLAKAQEKGAPPDAERLKAEIESLEREYQNQSRESDLIFQAEKTAREQVKTLHEKIEKNTQTLNRLKGIEERPERGKPAPPAETAGQGDKAASPSQNMLLPGTALQPQTEQLPGTEKPAAEQPIATAEQIEARKKAEVKKQEAEKAAEAIVETVERKEALQKEIALTTKMLTTYRDARASMEQRLEDLENELNQKITAGTDQVGRQKIEARLRTFKTE